MNLTPHSHICLVSPDEEWEPSFVIVFELSNSNVALVPSPFSSTQWHHRTNKLVLEPAELRTRSVYYILRLIFQNNLSPSLIECLLGGDTENT